MAFPRIIALAMLAGGLYQQAQAAGPQYKLLQSFEAGGNTSDGAVPSGLMAVAQGHLYGTTQLGGASSAGTVFQLDLMSKAESVLYTFKGGADGSNPSRDVVIRDGILYGTTAFGGEPQKGQYNETGTIFSINLATGVKRTLFKFPNDGSMSYAPGDLLYVNGLLYGVTAGGGDEGGPGYYGTIFSFDPKTRVLTTLHAFNPQSTLDGGAPLAGLINVDGKLFGTTQRGGNDAGCIYSYNLRTNTFKVLYSFGKIAGYPTQPQSTPVYLNGALYITSKGGGMVSSNFYGLGTVFKLDLKTGAGTILHSFQNGSDGELPLGGLVYLNGLLYGETGYGGDAGGGVLYSIDPATGAETNLHSFGASGDGNEPVAAMTNLRGNLFGTTAYGGQQTVGTIFKYTP